MQDSNLIQWKIVLKLTDKYVSSFCVGDVAQSIYGFRGANPNRLLTFIKKIEAKTFVLGHCYRSTSSLLRLTNFVRQHIDCKPERLKTNIASDVLPNLITHRDQDSLIVGLRHKLIELSNEITNFKSILILARTNKVVDKINQALEETVKNHFPEISKNHQIAMTMHKAKGLESDVCFVIDPRFSRSKYDNRDEYLRLVYVAITRAKSRLIICRKDVWDNFYIDGAEDDVDIFDSIKESEYLYLGSDK
jgi:DNA helicase-2/ATP-dependent DNA helicase PcrA